MSMADCIRDEALVTFGTLQRYQEDLGIWRLKIWIISK